MPVKDFILLVVYLLVLLTFNFTQSLMRQLHDSYRKIDLVKV